MRIKEEAAADQTGILLHPWQARAQASVPSLKISKVSLGPDFDWLPSYLLNCHWDKTCSESFPGNHAINWTFHIHLQRSLLILFPPVLNCENWFQLSHLDHPTPIIFQPSNNPGHHLRAGHWNQIVMLVKNTSAWSLLWPAPLKKQPSKEHLSSALPLPSGVAWFSHSLPQPLYHPCLLLHLKHPHHPCLLLPLVEQPVQVRPCQLHPPAYFGHPLFPTCGHLY